jgi:hypothetical protein
VVNQFPLLHPLFRDDSLSIVTEACGQGEDSGGGTGNDLNGSKLQWWTSAYARLQALILWHIKIEKKEVERKG